MSQQPAEALPAVQLPPKLAHKRLAQEQQPGQQEQQPEAPTATATTAQAEREPRPKAARITTSKILGTAHPRKPRVGPQFQAVIPDLEPR
jgi:hypothetical protein